MADIDELHAASVKGDLDMVKGAVKRGGLAAQKALAKMLRGKSHRSTPGEENKEGPAHEVAESPAYERMEHGGTAPFKKARTGSTSSAGASVGGGT